MAHFDVSFQPFKWTYGEHHLVSTILSVHLAAAFWLAVESHACRLLDAEI